MKYGLQFTTTDNKSWFNVWCESQEQRDNLYADLQKCDWQECAFNVGDTLVNLKYILTVRKIEEQDYGF